MVDIKVEFVEQSEGAPLGRPARRRRRARAQARMGEVDEVAADIARLQSMGIGGEP